MSATEPRAVLIGGVRFTRAALEALTPHLRPAMVLGLAPAAATRGSDYEDLSVAARALDLPFLPFRSIGDAATIEALRRLAPDVLLVFGLSQIVPPEVLDLAPALGTHVSPLPRGRGRHPIIWSIALGLHETALTVFRLTEQIDAGPILLQEPIPIDDSTDAGSLYADVEEAVRRLAPALAEAIRTGRLEGRRQEPAQATRWRRRTVDDEWIPWNLGVGRARNLVRALARPYPGARLALESGGVLRAMRAGPAGAPTHAAPGAVLSASPGSLEVACIDGTLQITEWEVITPPAPRPGDRACPAPPRPPGESSGVS